MTELFIIHSVWNPRYFLTFYKYSPSAFSGMNSFPEEAGFFCFSRSKYKFIQRYVCHRLKTHHSVLRTAKIVPTNRSISKVLYTFFTPLFYRSLLKLLLFAMKLWQSELSRRDSPFKGLGQLNLNVSISVSFQHVQHKSLVDQCASTRDRSRLPRVMRKAHNMTLQGTAQ